MPRIDLLHVLGEAPEGPWAIFSLPDGDGTDMVSVIIPRSLWLLLTRAQPFSSEITLMEQVGTRLIERRLATGEPITGPLLAGREDVGGLLPPEDIPWFQVLRMCQTCGQTVPPGEVLEGLSNALPPDSRGHIEVKVLCPACQVQSTHRLTPWGMVT